MKYDYPYNLNNTNDEFWIPKVCLTRIILNGNFLNSIKFLLNNGEISGELDWGIHRWNENTPLEYKIEEPFNGYRAYLGEDESDYTGIDDCVDEYIDLDSLKILLLECLNWYEKNHHDECKDINNLKKMIVNSNF